MLGYHYEIKYRPSTINSAADALSRRTKYCQSLIVSSPSNKILQLISGSRVNDPTYTDLLKRVSENPEVKPRYSVKQGFLLFDDRFYIPEDSNLRHLLFTAAHDTPTGGHSGHKSTMSRLCTSFFWPNMSNNISNWICSCPICQVTKSSTTKLAGLLQPLPTPNRIWEDLTMDFIMALPPSSGYTNISVVVDRLTKGAHFIPLVSPMTAPTVAHAFSKNMIKHHGVPCSIISDRDRIFLNTFWKEIFKLQGTLLKHSTTYRPQMDGQSEAVNRCL